MIQINLLEEEKRKGRARQSVDSTKPIIYFGLAVLVGAVVLVDVKMFAKVNALKKQTTIIQRQRKDPTHLAQLAKADELEKALEALNKKQIIIEDLIQNRIDWAKKLAALRDNLPSDVWIEQIALENPNNPRVTEQTLTIKGATLNYSRGLFRTAEVMDRLNQSPDFMAGFTGDLEDVESRNETWEKSAQEPPGDTPIWRFSIEAKRPLPASEVAKK